MPIAKTNTKPQYHLSAAMLHSLTYPFADIRLSECILHGSRFIRDKSQLRVECYI